MSNFVNRFNALHSAIEATCGNKRAAELAALCLVTGQLMLVESNDDISTLAYGVANAIKGGALKLVSGSGLLDSPLERAHVVLMRDIEQVRVKEQCMIIGHACEERQGVESGSSPFLVLARVRENQGDMMTEAMLDRFAICEPLQLEQRFLPNLGESVLELGEIMEMRREATNIHASDTMLEYLANLAQSFTRQPDAIPDELKGRLGVMRPHIRAMIHTLNLARVVAAKNGRDYVHPDDVQSLLPSVVCHRFGIRYPEGFNRYETGRAVARAVLEKVPVVAPKAA